MLDGIPAAMEAGEPVSRDSLSLEASCRLPTPWGLFRLHGFAEPATGREHLALTFGDVDDGFPVLARVHSECLTGEVLGSQRCDCGAQLDAAMAAIAKAGRGVVLYLRQEGRGIGLLNKLRAYALQDEGADTVEANLQLGFGADLRDYRVAAEMLRALGIGAVRLMTNNPRKIEGLARHGIGVVERVPLVTEAGVHNAGYLQTKSNRMGHLLDYKGRFH